MLPVPSPPYALGSALARFFPPKPKLITEDPRHQHRHMASGLERRKVVKAAYTGMQRPEPKGRGCPRTSKRLVGAEYMVYWIIAQEGEAR